MLIRRATSLGQHPLMILKESTTTHHLVAPHLQLPQLSRALLKGIQMELYPLSRMFDLYLPRAALGHLFYGELSVLSYPSITPVYLQRRPKHRPESWEVG